jgi:hypothetical protein
VANENRPRLGFGGVAILAGMAIFALFVAFVVGPMISQSSGVADEKVSFILGGIFFLVAIVCYSAAKFMAPKKNSEDSKNV